MSKISLETISINAKRDFAILFKKSWDLGQKYLKPYTQDDARCDFFISYSQLNLWLLLQLDAFLEILGDRIQISNYMKLMPKSRIHFLIQYDTINRRAYVTLKSTLDKQLADFAHNYAKIRLRWCVKIISNSV